MVGRIAAEAASVGGLLRLPLSGGDMEFTAKERNTVLAICQKKAQECRERASRIGFADLREAAEQTARMWEELAASVVGSSTLEQLFPSLGESKGKQS